MPIIKNVLLPALLLVMVLLTLESMNLLDTLTPRARLAIALYVGVTVTRVLD